MNEIMDNSTAREKFRGEYQWAKGPGKYQGNAWPMAAAYMHESTMTGGCERETGTVEYGPGWYGLLSLAPEEQAAIVDLTWDPDNTEPLDIPVAVILHEDSNGFVMATWYTDENEAEAAFDKCEAEYAILDDEEE